MMTAISPIAAKFVVYEAQNDTTKNLRNELIALMNQRLADAVDLQMQMKQAHWDVTGQNFISLHGLFDKVDAAFESYVDLALNGSCSWAASRWTLCACRLRARTWVNTRWASLIVRPTSRRSRKPCSPSLTKLAA